VPWPKRHLVKQLGGLGEFLNSEDESTIIIGQIESAAGVENIASILGTGALNAIIIGPNDLSVDLGLPGLTKHARVKEAIETVLEAALVKKVPVGIHLADEEYLKYWVAKGMSFIVYSYDLVMMVEQAKRALASLKSV